MDHNVTFYDIPDGTLVTIRAHSRFDAIDFLVEVKAHSEGFVLLDAAREEKDGVEVVIEFDSEYSSNEIIWNDNNQLHCFRPSSIKTLSFGNGEIYHVISGKITGHELNRRETPRFDYQVEGISVISGDNHINVVRTRDISQTGFSLISKKTASLGSTVNLAFYTELGHRVLLVGKIVRIIDEDGEHMFGCQMERDNPELTKVIMEIQRRKLAEGKRNRKG